MPIENSSADVVIIGGGPGGYVAAIRAAQLGLVTVCVEMDKTLGGTCVNVGCIPSKALLTSSEHYEFARQHAAEHGIRIEEKGLTLDLAMMLKRKDDVVAQNTRGIEFLFKKNKITWAKGKGSLRRTEKGLEVAVAPSAPASGGAPPQDSIASYLAKNVIIATGSVPIELPFLKFDEERILSNIGALTIPRVPRHLIVIGGGVIGLELGSVWRRLGANVTIVELMPTILPGMDDDVIKECDRVFRRQGLDLRTGTRVVGGRREADRVDAASLGIDVGRRGEILVDDRMRTGAPNVYAIGDCVPGPMLAHKAEEEGVVAAESIAGQNVHMHYKSIPNVVYTWPEIAAVGLTEREVKQDGREYRVGRFPFSANGRARTMGETDGFVKFIADARTDELLGAHLVGPNVSELVSEVVLGFEYRASADDLGMTVHAHPTLAESTKEAALATLGRALHI